MSKKLWKKEQLIVSEYSQRCDDREVTLMTATMNFVGYFIMLDNSSDDDLTKKSNAEIKVAQLSTEVAAFLYSYRLGNTQPLIDGINNSNLEFMDAAAKEKIVSDLSI